MTRTTVVRTRGLAVLALLAVLVSQCVAPPIKKLYLLNYEPDPMAKRLNRAPYPFTLRIKDFEIEKAYDRLQITYRHSPYELRYYYYHVWAVKPTAMLTDLVHKHLVSSSLVSQVIRRLDEGTERPHFELTGTIEAIEEYDSEEVWFAHLALRLRLVRLRDNRTVYLRRFDKRKPVHVHEPEFVVRELSQIMDVIMTQALRDIDPILGREYGLSPGSESPSAEGDSTYETGESDE